MEVGLKNHQNKLIKAEFDIKGLSPSSVQPDYNVILVGATFSMKDLPVKIFERNSSDIKEGKDLDFTLHILNKNTKDVKLKAIISFFAGNKKIGQYNCPKNGNDASPSAVEVDIQIKGTASKDTNKVYVHRGAITFTHLI